MNNNYIAMHSTISTNCYGNDFPTREVYDIARRSVEVCARSKGWYLRAIEIDDVIQDTVIKAFQYWNTFNPERAQLKTWVSRIAVQRLSDALKKEKGLTPLEYHSKEGDSYIRFDRTYDVGYEADRGLESYETMESISEAINSIPGNQKRILELSLDEDLKPRQMAERVGCSADAAAVLLCRARKAVRKRLGHEFMDEQGFAA